MVLQVFDGLVELPLEDLELFGLGFRRRGRRSAVGQQGVRRRALDITILVGVKDNKNKITSHF